jgi:hypothetical protein
MNIFRIKHLGVWLTLALNLFLFAEYLFDHRNAHNIIFIFWIQSLLLGLENVFMMLFARTGLPIVVNNEPTTTSWLTNIFMTAFFSFHYGIFIIAFGLIAVFTTNIPGALHVVSWLWPTLVVMAIGALLELPGKIVEVRKRSTSLFGLMFMPYLRLLPFVVIIFGGEKIMSNWLFPLFLLAKIVVDLAYFKFFNFNQANRAILP